MDQITVLLPQILQIIWINILLSGDNAVVIALACRGLPAKQRTIGIALGAGAAIALRIVFTLLTTQIMGLPWLKAVGALALLWIAVKLIVPEETSEDSIAGHDSLWKAVQTVAVADVVMSLDNVIAIAAAAKGNTGLIIFGLVVSIPLVIVGSNLLMKVIDRFPALVWLGAALLGWIAGELLVEDPGVIGLLGGKHLPVIPMQIGGAVLVVLLGYVFKKRHEAAHRRTAH
jgi:YjbE family integral membrane protein